MSMVMRSLTLLLLVPAVLRGQAKEDTVTYQLPPVTTTAARSSQDLLTVPFSVSVVGTEELRGTAARGFDAVLGGIPGVVAQSRSGGLDVRLTIRGFGARGAGERSNAGTSRGVRILSNGFPETEPDGRTAFDLVDLSGAGRIEVVRSNASSAWGNASGGVINVSANTAFERPYLGLTTYAGSYGYKKQSVNAGALLGSGRFYLSLSDLQSDGYRAHSAAAQTQLSTGFVSAAGDRTTYGIHLSAATTIFRIPGPLTQAQFDADPSQAQGDPANYNPTYVQRDERRFNRQGRIGVTMSHAIDPALTLSAMAFINPKYLQRSERNTFRDFTRYHAGGNVVLRHAWASASGLRSDLAAGIDEAYQDGAILFYNLVNGNRGTTVRDDKREGANNIGLFVQEELTLDEHWVLMAGGRYDAVTYYNQNYLNPAIDKDRSFTRLTPKGGVTYRFDGGHSLYASVGGGIEVPAGNETDPPSTFGEDTLTAINPLLEPITSTTVEIGTKNVVSGDGLVRSVGYDAAFYWITTSNDIIPYRGGRFYFTAGKTRRLGAELSVRAELEGGFSCMTSLGLSDNEYRDYVVDSVHYGAPGKTKDFSGNAMAGVPDLMYQARLRYAPAVVTAPFVEASVHGLGSYTSDDANLFGVPAYTVVDLSAGVRSVPLAAERLALHAWVTLANAFDKKYVSSAFVNPDLNGAKEPIYLEPGLPRNVMGSLGLEWQF
jgi:iron complex outermembrane receptor protein